MNFASLKPTLPRLQRSAVALALAAIGASAHALPVFTLNPDALIAGAPTADITADNIIVSDYSTVRFTSATTFTIEGYLDVQRFQLGSTQVDTPTLGIDYGMYFYFTGEGTTDGKDPTVDFTNGFFTKLDYSFYGYTGSADFGFDTGNNPLANVNGDVLLATGELRGGTVGTDPDQDGPLFGTDAKASLSFEIDPLAGAFFAAPETFYNVAIAAFTNSSDKVFFFDGGSGFTVTQGGGTVAFAAPIPEPETYALMLAGLAAVGFVARRRRPQN